MLQEYFTLEGWQTVSLLARELRDREMTIHALMAQQPDAIVFDVSIPYEANWTTVQRLRQDPQLRCPIIVTTTNEAALRRLVGAGAIEIVGKPYDLARLRDTVVAALDPREHADAGPSDERRVKDRRERDRRTPPTPDN